MKFVLSRHFFVVYDLLYVGLCQLRCPSRAVFRPLRIMPIEPAAALAACMAALANDPEGRGKIAASLKSLHPDEFTSAFAPDVTAPPEEILAYFRARVAEGEAL